MIDFNLWAFAGILYVSVTMIIVGVVGYIASKIIFKDEDLL